jgi:histidine triad (HIT) family protein
MATIYDKIINKEIDQGTLYEDDLTMAFLDYNPVTKGHALVIPKQAVNHLDDCSDELYQAIFRTVHHVSKQLRKKLGAKRISIVVHGFEVPHAHVHIVPLYTGHELSLAKRDTTPVPLAELQALAKTLRIA